MRVLDSTTLGAIFETHAAFGEDFCNQHPAFLERQVRHTIERRREGEAARARERNRREAFWRGIAEGNLARLVLTGGRA